MYGSQTETFLVPFSNQVAGDSSSLSFSCEKRNTLWLTSVLFLLQTGDRVSCVITGADNNDKDAVQKQRGDPSQWSQRKVCFSHVGNFFQEWKCSRPLNHKTAKYSGWCEPVISLVAKQGELKIFSVYMHIKLVIRSWDVQLAFNTREYLFFLSTIFGKTLALAAASNSFARASRFFHS